jgi:hypothetical protein
VRDPIPHLTREMERATRIARSPNVVLAAAVEKASSDRPLRFSGGKAVFESAYRDICAAFLCACFSGASSNEIAALGRDVFLGLETLRANGIRLP